MAKFLALLAVVNSAFSLSTRSTNELQFKIIKEETDAQFDSIKVFKDGTWRNGPCRIDGSAGTADEQYELHESLNKTRCAEKCLEDVKCKAYEARINTDHRRCEIWRTLPNGVKDFRETWECKIKTYMVDILNFDDMNLLDIHPFGLDFFSELEYKGFYFEQVLWYDIRGLYYTFGGPQNDKDFLGVENNLVNGPASPTVTIIPGIPYEALVMSKSESFSVFSFKATLIFDTPLLERELYIAGFDSENNMVAVQSVTITFGQKHREIELSSDFQDIFKIEFKIAQVTGHYELSYYYMLDDIVYSITGIPASVPATSSGPATSSVPTRRDTVDSDPVSFFHTGEVSTKTETDPKEMFENNQ
eukprot:Awhi_evm1s6993